MGTQMIHPRYLRDEGLPVQIEPPQDEITALRKARHELLMLLVAVLWSNIQAHEDIETFRAERDAIAELLRQRDELIASFSDAKERSQ